MSLIPRHWKETRKLSFSFILSFRFITVPKPESIRIAAGMFVSRNSKARNSKCGPRTGRVGKDQGRCFLVAGRGMHSSTDVYGNDDRYLPIDVRAIALAAISRIFRNPLQNRTRFLDCRSSLNEKRVGLSPWTMTTANPIKFDSRRSSLSRGRDREGLCERIMQIEVGRPICVTVILDGRLKQNFLD